MILKRDQIEMLKVLNGYENIGRTIISHLWKLKEHELMLPKEQC